MAREFFVLVVACQLWVQKDLLGTLQNKETKLSLPVCKKCVKVLVDSTTAQAETMGAKIDLI